MSAPLKPVTHHDYHFKPAGSSRQPLGSWSHVRTEEGLSTTEAIIRCLDCGGLVHLGPNHKISTEGWVAPSIGCPWCGWHVFGRLVGWPEGTR